MYIKHKSIGNYSNHEQKSYSEHQNSELMRIQFSHLSKSKSIANMFKLRLIFQEWSNIIAQENYRKRKLNRILLRNEKKNIKKIINKWRESMQYIRIVQQNIKNFIFKRKREIKLKILKQLRGDNAVKKLLCMKLGSLESKYKHIAKLNTFQIMQSFSMSRMASNYLQKGRAAKSMVQWIS